MRVGSVDGSVNGLYQVVYDSGVLASATTSIDVTGLEGNTDEVYRILFYYVHNVSSSTDGGVNLRVNNDSGGNYTRQNVIGSTIVSASESENVTHISSLSYCEDDEETALADVFLYVKSGANRGARITRSDRNNGIPKIAMLSGEWKDTSTEITQLNFDGTISNCIGAGSRVVVLKQVHNEVGLKTGDINVEGDVSGALQLVYEAELTTPSQSITVSNLDGDEDVVYFIRWLVVDDGGIGSILFRPNNDSDANYKYVSIYQDSATIGITNNTSFSGFHCTYCNTNGDINECDIVFWAASGHKRKHICRAFREVSGASGRVDYRGGEWTNTSSNVTSIVFVAGTDNQDSGSKVQIYKINL